MRKLIFFMLGFFIWQSALSQIQPLQTEKNAGGYLKTNNGVIIYGRSYTASTNDTTEVISLLHHKTVYLTVQSNDSTTILIDYALSNDPANFPAFTTKDSLSHNINGVGFKSIDFTSTTLGAMYIRFRLRHSANAFILGTTSPTYNANWFLKKE